MEDLVGFVGRHLIASMLGTLGVIVYILGVAEQAEAIATRFKPWQLQSLGAALFVIFVVMVLSSYDKDHRIRSQRVTQTSALQAVEQVAVDNGKIPEFITPSGRPVRESDSLPESVSEAYLRLFSENGTRLQKRRFLKMYENKYLVLNLPVVHMENLRDGVWAQFDAGAADSIFAYFGPEWEDHLLEMKKGDMLRFRAQIVATDNDYVLRNAAPTGL